ncbi:MAG: pro-sigmaK processing inhibitor BofA family protein [Ruminococcus sp.]|nr:pro-sigmaK processing inhibitor BofA family protein [Ruminococcus sp.]
MDTEAIFRLICGGAAAVMIVCCARRRHRLLSVLLGSGTGLAALMLVNLFGSSIGAHIPLNLFNVCGSTVLGAPFVAALIIIRYI